MPTSGSKSGTTTVELTSANGMGAKATSSGENIIQDVTSVTVGTDAATGTGNDAMHAESGGKNIFQRITDAVKLFVNNGDGMDANGTDSENSILDAGSVEMHATQAGMRATAGGENTITTRVDASQTGNVDITVKSATLNSAYGMSAETDSANKVNASGTVDIKVKAEVEGFGLSSTGTGRNTVEAVEDIKVEVNSTQGAHGVSGQTTLKAGGDITIDAISEKAGGSGVSNLGTTTITAGGALKVTAENKSESAQSDQSNSHTVGLVNGNGSVTIKADSIDISASISANQSNATGISQGEGPTTLTATNDITISASKTGTSTGADDAARGITTWGGTDKSTLSVTSEQGNITINADDNGIIPNGNGGTRNSGANAVNLGGGNVDVTLNAVNGTVSLQANQNSGDLGITPGSYAWGVNNQGVGTFSVQAKQADINVTAAIDAFGLSAARSAGESRITANTVNMNIHAGGTATGMNTYYSGTSEGGNNTITARPVDGSGVSTGTGTVNMQLTGDSATGMNTRIAGNNLIDADHVNITATASATAPGWATGLSAMDLGSNTIKSNDVNIILTGASTKGLGASASGTDVARNTVQGTEQGSSFYLNMTASGGNSSGMEAGTGGVNTINGFSSVTIQGTADKDTTSDKGKAYGMNASSTGHNTISNAGDVAINMESIGAQAFGMSASSNGQNTIENVASVDIDAFGKGLAGKDYSRGLSAESDGANTIKSVDGKVSVAAGDYALGAWSGGVNTIDTAGSVEISGGYKGLYANTVDGGASGGRNIIQNIHADASVAGADGKVIITSETSYAVDASGAHSSNLIDDVDSVKITKTSGPSDNIALYTTGGGKNTISNVKGAVEIKADGKGVYAQTEGSLNEINGAASVTVDAGIAVHALNGGDNTMNAGTVNLNGRVGLYASTEDSKGSGSTNTITATENVNMTISGTGYLGEKALGMWAFNNSNGQDSLASTNTINAKNVILAVNVDANGNPTGAGGSAGMMASGAAIAGAARNTITGTESVDIKVGSTNSTAYGMWATDKGHNEILGAGTVTLKSSTTSTQDSARSYGMFASSKGENTIKDADAVSITSTATGALPTLNRDYGLYAIGAGSANTIKNTTTTVNVTSTNGLGIYAIDKGTNIIDWASAATITSRSWGLGAEGAGTNVIQNVAGKVLVNSRDSTGVYATGAGSSNRIGTDGKGFELGKGTVGEVEVKGNPAGIHANAGGINEIANVTGAVTISNNLSGDTWAAMRATGVGNGTASLNTIHHAGAVNINGVTYGMSAAEGGQNKISDIAGAIAINLRDTKGMAMYAEDAGSANTISAGSHALEVRITMAAGFGKDAYAMYATGGGKNIIEGSDEKDYISLQGAVKVYGSGENIIRTGAGDDHVVLDGTVSTGGLTLHMGAGHDTLTLKAGSYEEFLTRYGDWLKAIAADPDFGVESIQIAGGWDNWSLTDKANLLNYFQNNSVFDNIDVPTAQDPIAAVEDLTNTDVTHTATTHIDQHGDFDGTTPLLDNSTHSFESTGNDMVRVGGNLSNTDLTFAGAGHDTLSVAGTLSNVHITTDAAYTGTLHVAAGELDDTQLDFEGGTVSLLLHGNGGSTSTLAFAAGNDTLNVQGDFTGKASMGAGDDLVTLHGNAHGGMVDGGAGNDTLGGDAGNNILVGGTGFDVLTGGAGADTFVWNAGDKGTAGAPATDMITDFNISDGDKLNLRDLLQGHDADHLDNYLKVTQDGTNTVLSISTTGESADDKFDQVIVLQNNNLTEDQLMQHVLLNQ